MTNTSRAGARKERMVKEFMEQDGYTVRKARMSFGSADLLCEKRENGKLERILIQVKANKGSPYKNFGKADRDALSEDARIAGAKAWLVHWPAHYDMVIYAEEDWPGNWLKTPIPDLLKWKNDDGYYKWVRKE